MIDTRTVLICRLWRSGYSSGGRLGCGGYQGRGSCWCRRWCGYGWFHTQGEIIVRRTVLKPLQIGRRGLPDGVISNDIVKVTIGLSEWCRRVRQAEIFGGRAFTEVSLEGRPKEVRGINDVFGEFPRESQFNRGVVVFVGAVAGGGKPLPANVGR